METARFSEFLTGRYFKIILGYVLAGLAFTIMTILGYQRLFAHYSNPLERMSWSLALGIMGITLFPLLRPLVGMRKKHGMITFNESCPRTMEYAGIIFFDLTRRRAKVRFYSLKKSSVETLQLPVFIFPPLDEIVVQLGTLLEHATKRCKAGDTLYSMEV